MGQRQNNSKTCACNKKQKSAAASIKYREVYGYKVDRRIGTYSIDYEKIPVVRHILVSFHSFGEITPIVHELNSIMFIPSPTGKKWTSKSVLQIIKEETYSGVLTYTTKDNELVRKENACPAVITPEVYQENQKLLEKLAIKVDQTVD